MTRSRKRKLRRQAALAGLPFASMVAAVPSALAQQAGTGPLGEIIVTAEKREESLQKVPFAIQAFGTEQLEQMQVKNFSDFALLVPSMGVQSAGPGFARIYIRGVASGENGNHSGPLPSVGVYLDEQPITTIQGPLDFHVYDLQRIEVLEGPQGTLYGASSQSGTIRYITNKPKIGEFEARYDLNVNTVSHGDPGGSVEGMVNIPINDRMAVRLVGYWESDGGYIDNVAGTRNYPKKNPNDPAWPDVPYDPALFGCTSNFSPPAAGCDQSPSQAKPNYNDVQVYGGRAALKINLNENWTTDVSVIGQDQISHGLFGYDPRVGDLAVTHFYPEFTDDHWIQAGLTVQGKVGKFDLTYAGSYLKRNDVTRSDYTDYTFFYDTLYDSTWTDHNGNIIKNPSQYIDGTDEYNKVSQELRLATPQDWRLRGVTGLFFQSQQHYILQDYKIDGLGSRSGAFLDDTTTLSVYGWKDTIWLTDQKRVDRDYAWFGEITYDIIPDKLSILGGWRWFQTHNSLRGYYGFSRNWSSKYEATCVDPAQFEDPLRGAPCTNLDKVTEKTDWVPKGTLTWRIDDERLVYFTYSQGFRPGGINRVGTFGAYEPDTLTNYEVGLKSTWFDKRVRFNTALFREVWDKIQYSYLPPGGNGLTVIQNAGAATMQGIEAQLDWSPLDGLTISAAASVIHTELSEDYFQDPNHAADATPDAPKGAQLPVTPNFQGNLTGRYQFPVMGFDSHVQASLGYRGPAWSDFLTADRAIIGQSPAYLLLDLAAGIEKGSWSLELYMKNVTDERADFYRSTECSTSACGTNPYIYTNVPRNFGIQFGQKF